jgi:hypothetical protein
MWYKELDGKLDYDCFLCCDDTVVIEPYVALAKTIFRSVGTIRYRRHKHSHWPFQQNNAFLNAAMAMSKQKEPWVWIETDSTPVKRGWLKTLETEYLKGGKPFGGHWNPATNIFNGVAIYPPKISHYAPKMLLAPLIDAKNQGKPYQPPWDFYGSKEVFPHLHVMNNVMQHIWDVNGICPTFPDGDKVVEMVRPEVVIFHRCKDGTLMDRLRDPGRIGSKARCLVGLDTVHLKKAEPPPIPVQRKPLPQVTTSLFIVSYKGDFDWLPYLFKSIDRHCKGFDEAVLALPEQDVPLLKAPKWLKVVGYSDKSFASSFMGHLWAKLSADQFCSGDVVVMLDSDCIFTGLTTPATYITQDGKCINLCTKYSTLGDSVPWQPCTEKVLGRAVEYETMRRHGNCYPRELFPRLRQHIEKVMRRPMKELLELIKDRGSAKDVTVFSEFNTAGAYGMYFMPDSFQFIDTEKEKVPANPIHQFWSKHRANHSDVQKVLKEHKLL